MCVCMHVLLATIMSNCSTDLTIKGFLCICFQLGYHRALCCLQIQNREKHIVDKL